MVKDINDGELIENILKFEKVLVDVWAPWCGPCKMLSPIVEEVAKELPDVAVVKINADDNKEITAQYGIRSIPTLLFFKNGVLVDKHVGLVLKNVIVEKINTL